MRAFLLTLTLLAIPVAGYAQSTVGSVPANANAIPAVNGSSAPKVAPNKIAKHKAATAKPVRQATVVPHG